ncbi:MAG TPA: hypothetical protein VGJ61_04675 [Solirubrobacterales bacterium]|jgi:hypothetical protein
MVGDRGFVIEPVVREEAIEGYSETMRPVLRREVITEDKERQAVPQRHLFEPIPVPTSGHRER